MSQADLSARSASLHLSRPELSISQAQSGAPVELRVVFNSHVLACTSVISVTDSLVDLNGPCHVRLLRPTQSCAANFLLPLASSALWMEWPGQRRAGEGYLHPN